MLQKMLPYQPILPLNKNPKLNRRSFTLVELLIAVSIFSVVTIAIYSTFNSGVMILRRVRNLGFTQQKILLKTEKLARQLRQQPLYKRQLFIGEKTRISFAAIALDYYPARLTYFFDSRTLSLMVALDRLDEIIASDGRIDPEPKAKAQVYLTKVKDVKFSYLYLDSVKNEYSWKDTWDIHFLPLAVKFTILLVNNKEYEQTVFLSRTQ